MGLKPCRECDEQVSSQAAICPRCGIKHPTIGYVRLWFNHFASAILGVFLILGILAWANHPDATAPEPSATALTAAVGKASDANTKDDDTPGTTTLHACIYYNAKRGDFPIYDAHVRINTLFRLHSLCEQDFKTAWLACTNSGESHKDCSMKFNRTEWQAIYAAQ
jgi:hypothetical protein